jgi:hypothetical protein
MSIIHTTWRQKFIGARANDMAIKRPDHVAALLAVESSAMQHG